MANASFSEGELTPGTMYYMRHWSIEGRKIQVAEFKTVDGQLWWIPLDSVAKGVAPRSFCMMVDNRPVAVRGTPEYRTSERPARLIVELATDVVPESGPTSIRPVRKVYVTFTELVQRLADGWETVDATLEAM